MKDLEKIKLRELNDIEKNTIQGGSDLETLLKRAADAIRDYVYDKTGYCMYE